MAEKRKQVYDRGTCEVKMEERLKYEEAKERKMNDETCERRKGGRKLWVCER